MGRFIHTDKWQEPSAAEVFNQRQNVARLGQQAFQQSQKNTNDTVGNTAFGHLVDAAQANAAGLFAGQLRAVDEGLNWAGEKLGLAEKTGTRDKSGWLEQAAQAMDEVQRRNTAQEELTGLNYLAQQVGSVLGSMAAMTAETVALGGGLSLAGKGVGALARLAGIASKTNAGANVNNIIGASGNLTSKAIGAARKMWGGNYLQNYYKLQMMNSPAEALGQAGNLLKQLEDEGYDRDTIRAAALWSGTLNAAFLPLANMAEGKMASMGANMIAKNIVGKEAAKAAMVPTMLGLKATLGKAAGTSAWQGLTEGGEEGVQDYIDQFSTQLAQGKDFKDMEWDHATAAKSFIDAGVGSAALGFLGGATNYRSRAKNFNANGHNFQLSDDGRTWSVDGKDRIMKPDFNEDGTPAIDKETNKQTESLQPYTAKEIADLMGNDVTEADVRGAMRAEKAKTSKVSSGDARPVAVKPDAKKEETKQQPVPGFTILEDGSGNTIYTDNISGVEYNSKDGWVVPANDNTDGKQLYNTNTGNFANANTKRVLPNGDTVDVVSGEVTKKENEVKNTQEDTTVPKKENVITPPVEPAPVAARQFTPFNGVGYRRARPKGEIVYDEDIYVDTNDDSGWRQLPNGTWENTITGEKSESKPEKIVNTTVGDETVGDDNPPASNENKPQPSYVGKKITYTSENRTAVDRKKKTVDNLLNAGFITKKVHDGVIHALDTNKHARDKKTKLARIIESVSKKPFTMPSNDVIASKLEEIKLQKQKEEKKNGKGSKQNSKPKQAEVKVTEDINQSKPEVGKGREETQEVEVKLEPQKPIEMSEDDLVDFYDEVIDPRKYDEEKYDEVMDKFDVASEDGVTPISDFVKETARKAITLNKTDFYRGTLKSVQKFLPEAMDYYDYLVDKYSPKDTAETTKVVAEQAPVVNQEQAEEVAAPAEVAVETKAPVDPEAQARDLSKNNKTTKGRKALLYSFINGSLRKVELMFNLNKNSLAFPEASLVALRDEFNKNKYFDKVKVRREEGMNDVEEFLRAVNSVEDKLLEQVKLEDGRTMKDLLYAFKENTSAEIEKLVSYKADEQAIMDKAQEEMSGLAENDPKRTKVVKAAEKKIDSMRKKQIAEQEKLLGKDASSNPLQGLKLSLQKSAYKALKNVVAPNSTLEERVDLLDAALVGIMKAARKYKPFMGADVATYAMPFIKNEMIKRLQEKTGVNSAEYKLAQELDKAVAQLTEEKLDVTDEALAQRMNENNSDNDKYTPVTAEDLKEIRKTQLKLQGTRSFSESVTDDGSVELGDTIPDKDAQAAFDAIDNDDTNRASIVQATQQDTEMRDRIITPENEKKVVAQLQKLFGGYDMKEVSPHKYEIKLPNGNSLQIDMSKTSAQLIDKLGNKVGELADIADVQGNVAVAGLYSAEDGINLIRLTDAVRNGTVPHEVAHFVFNAVFNETERRKVLDYYKSKVTDRTGLTEEQLNRRAEEMFCDDFAEYFLKDKSEPKSKLQRMFEKMKRFLRKLVDMFSFKNHPYTEEELDLRRDDVDVNAESLAALYGRMVNGDIYNREFNDGVSAADTERAQLVSVPQASNVAETKALVEKAKEMYANGATDNEVWQATGCKRYNDGTIKLYVPFTEQDIISNGISEDFIPQRDADVVNGKVENPFPELIDSENISVKQSVSVKLSDMLSPDNIFFKMIPSLKDTTVRYIVPTEKVARALGEGAGLYDIGTNTITLVVNSISPGGKITFSEGKTLAHELQHAIQQADNGVARDNALGVLYSNAYDVDPMENEARYAETTYKNESLAKGDDELLTSRRENYGTFTAKVYSIVRDMKNNPIIRNKVPGLIARTQKILMSMAGAYGNGTAALPNGSAYGGALREPFVNLYNYAKNKASVEQLNNLRDIMDRVTELSRDFNARQVELLRKGQPMSMPNNEYLGEDTQGRLEAAKGMFSGSNITEDADGKVRVTFDDVPTLDGKPTTDEIGGAIVNADNKVLRKLRKGDTTIKDDVKPKDPIVFDPNATGDENNKFSLLDWLRSPSRLAKKFRKVFEFFAKTFDTAYRVQNQLRYEWHNMLKEATEFLSDSVENFNLFNDLMLYGDSYRTLNDKGEYENTGIDFDANQLNGMVYYIAGENDISGVPAGQKVFVPSDQQFIPEGVETHQLPENVAKAYLKVRELTETIYAAVDRARRSGLIKTEKANLQRILQINDPKNRAEGYIEIKGSDGQYHSLDEFRQYLNDKDTYDIRYAKIRVIDQKAVEVGVSQERVNDIKNDDTLEFVVASENKDVKGTFNVQYVKYMPHMGHRRGHVPHIFERWMVAYVNDDGSYTIQDSQKTVNAARESITKFQEQDADNNVQRQYVIFPKAFDFGSFNGADEVTGGGALATQKQKQEMYVNLIKNYMMTPEEANRAVNAAMRTSVKNRIYGQAVKRKGVAGYSKDVMDALIREVTSASRYCALQPAKHAAIDRYEHLFNMNYNADIKIGDNPLQAMVKSYIDDCNGKPSKAEQLLNRTLNNWDFWRNNISATYGDRAILQAASVANQITSMAKLGFWNISSAVVNLFQNMNTIALCGFGHFGEGVKAFRDLKFKDKDKLTGKELADYLLNEQIIEQTGVKYDIGMDSATGYSMRLERLKNNTDVGTPKGLLQVIYDNYMRIGDKGLALFSGAEAANRQICVLTAYRDGIAKGMTHDEAIEYAREVNKKANFDYGVADTPAFMRAMSGTGVGEMMMLFQKYPVKELELMCEMCKKAMSNTDGDKAQAARFWGMYFLMSGIGGIPFLDGFDEWLEHLFGYKPSKRAKLELIDTFGDNAFTRSVCYGVGATAGIDISQRVGMGDLKFGNSQLMFPFNFGGAAGSTLKQMIEAAMEGDPVHIAKAFSPSIGAVLEAGQGYSTDKKGRLRTLYSVPQMFVRSTGFRPIEDSVNADLNTALTEQRSDDRNEKSKFKYQIALKQTQGQPLTADDQRKLRTMNISGKQLADARKQIKQSFAKRAKELMSKEQRQRYGSVYEDFEREEDDI